MRLYVGVTDGDWYELLAAQPHLDEVNFWQPSGHRTFQALDPGELFLFKLHSPRNFVVGGGVFAHSTLLPSSLAWESFEIANGARTFPEMRQRIEKYRKIKPQSHQDYAIGCILVEQPFFLPRDLWIPGPPGWSPNIVQGRTYPLDQPEGRKLWDLLSNSMSRAGLISPLEPVPKGGPGRTTPELPLNLGSETPAWGTGGERYGSPSVVRPRLGQGSFRVVVTDAYERRCAVTGERTLPVLEAAHIRPYSEGGDHRVDNGLLLRRDLHTLFDRGYVTVTPDLHLEVSQRLREHWENGRDYYAMQGRPLRLPGQSVERPSAEFLKWHNEKCYQG